MRENPVIRTTGNGGRQRAGKSRRYPLKISFPYGGPGLLSNERFLAPTVDNT